MKDLEAKKDMIKELQRQNETLLRQTQDLGSQLTSMEASLGAEREGRLVEAEEGIAARERLSADVRALEKGMEEQMGRHGETVKQHGEVCVHDLQAQTWTCN